MVLSDWHYACSQLYLQLEHVSIIIIDHDTLPSVQQFVRESCNFCVVDERSVRMLKIQIPTLCGRNFVLYACVLHGWRFKIVTEVTTKLGEMALTFFLCNWY